MIRTQEKNIIEEKRRFGEGMIQDVQVILEFILRDKDVLAGRVVDASGAGVAHATVVLSNSQVRIPVDGSKGPWPSFEAQTYEQGAYSFGISPDLALWRTSLQHNS